MLTPSSTAGRFRDDESGDATRPARLDGRNWPIMRRDATVRQIPAPPREPDVAGPTLRTSQNACYEALSLALKEGQVFAALTGPVGSGKTTVLEAVLADRRDRALRCIRITDPDKVPAALAAQIEQVAYTEASKPENQGRHIVLAVDDAHLASAELLLCLSRLAAMREPGRRVPQILLSGRPELWDRLSAEEYEPLARRLAIRAALPALEEEDDDPWAIVEDEITQTMAQLRAEAEKPLALREEYDEASEREALFGASYAYGAGNSGNAAGPVAQSYEEEEDVPPPSVYALFPDAPPRAERSSARETRRRLLMPLVSLFVGLASFAFALSFYDWPDLIGDMPWSEAKPSQPFVMPRSPQERSFGLPMLPPTTNQSASGARPSAATPKPTPTTPPAPRPSPIAPVTPSVTARPEPTPPVASVAPPPPAAPTPAPAAEAPAAPAEQPPAALAPVVQAPPIEAPPVQAPVASTPTVQAPALPPPVVPAPMTQAPMATASVVPPSAPPPPRLAGACGRRSARSRVGGSAAAPRRRANRDRRHLGRSAALRTRRRIGQRPGGAATRPDLRLGFPALGRRRRPRRRYAGPAVVRACRGVGQRGRGGPAQIPQSRTLMVRRLTSRVFSLAGAALCITLAAAPFASAREPVPPRAVLPVIPDTQVVPPTSVLGIVSGGLSGTYIRIANDVATVFAAKVPEFRVLPIVGRGSLQNMSDILNVRDVDIGIVQSDVLQFLRQKPSLSTLTNNISYLAKLYDEEVHILGRDDIASAAELTGKRVSVDALGTGTFLTASVVFEALGVKPIINHDDPEVALAKLKRGELDALVYVTGKPARLFSDVGSSKLHFLAIPLNPALLQTYLPTRLTHADYTSLVPEDSPVETVAVGAVMAVYNWAPGSERFTRLSRFVDSFFDNLGELQQPGRHPKWKQVSLTAQVPGWSRFRGAQSWLARHGTRTP